MRTLFTLFILVLFLSPSVLAVTVESGVTFVSDERTYVSIDTTEPSTITVSDEVYFDGLSICTGVFKDYFQATPFCSQSDEVTSNGLAAINTFSSFFAIIAVVFAGMVALGFMMYRGATMTLEVIMGSVVAFVVVIVMMIIGARLLGAI